METRSCDFSSGMGKGGPGGEMSGWLGVPLPEECVVVRAVHGGTGDESPEWRDIGA